MSVPQSYLDRLSAGIAFRWPELPPRVLSAGEADPSAAVLQLRREKKSHQGVGKLRALRTLLAYQVDQSFLDELCELTQLQTLYIEGLTASDLEGLARLSGLQRLVINGASRIENLDWTAGLAPSLQALAVENAKKVCSIEPLATLTGLKTLAVEGSLHSAMKVASLNPLSALDGLEYLFLTALRVEDKRLAPLAKLAHLRVLEFADYYAAGEIDALAASLPNTRCRWFDEDMKKHRWEYRQAKK